MVVNIISTRKGVIAMKIARTFHELNSYLFLILNRLK